MRSWHEQAREVPLTLNEIEPSCWPIGRVLEMSLVKFLGPTEALRVGLSFGRSCRISFRSEPDGSRE
jgi:hypothetical protein